MTAIRDTMAHRGQPLWALAGMLLCWIAVRAALFEWPAAPPRLLSEAAAEILGRAGSPMTRPIARTAPDLADASDRDAILRPARFAGAVGLASRALALTDPMPFPASAPDKAQHAAGHNLLWMAAMGAVPLLPEVAAALAGTRPATAAGVAADTGARPSRWSGDAWLAWRFGSRAREPLGTVTPVYGASQAGAVLRYDLAPGSRGHPSAYVRAVSALERGREHDLAAGLTVRPLAGLPISAHGELRLSHRERGAALRPAAFVSGGIEGAPLVHGILARGYAQAGYVGGPEATGFADGSLIAERPVWRDRDAALTIGAGTWGGAQRGAARLDLGPTASLRFRLGETAARLSADYRLRVAGNAEPASGAALTLTAGF